jgi:hypothetical protein
MLLVVAGRDSNHQFYQTWLLLSPGRSLSTAAVTEVTRITLKPKLRVAPAAFCGGNV